MDLVLHRNVRIEFAPASQVNARGQTSTSDQTTSPESNEDDRVHALEAVCAVITVASHAAIAVRFQAIKIVFGGR